MKTLLPKAFLVIAMALPLVAATPKPKPPVPTFGGFAKGAKFSLNVTDFDSSSITGQVTTNPAPIPAGVPKFKVGQKVSFTIGPKGELTGTGFKILFLPGSASIASNGYINLPSAKNPQPFAATVFKNTTTGAPSGAALNFFTFKRKGIIFTVSAVTYILKS
ncbi:MAG: hypothetical protein JWO82_2251 [Akkermansiaceae bacterium]|nr:hypothetical protein [Akkermansiaceae bacterium]